MFRRRRSRDPRDFADEVRAHLELEEARLRDEGLSADEAHRQARRAFGHPTGAVERVYEARPGRWLETLVAHFEDDHIVAVGSASVPRWEHDRPRWFAPELDWTVGCSYRGLPETASIVRNVFGGAMAMRCSAARTLGGFDHQLGRGGNRYRD